MSERRKIYVFFSLLCTIGYAWIVFQLIQHDSNGSNTFGVCLFKHVTHIPCPSCGTTRSMLALIHGHIGEAFLLNPLGVLLAPAVLLLPVWLLADLFRRDDSFYRAYLRGEAFVKRWYIALPLVLLLLANWGWNIIKAL